jgi:hypothetical protein
MKKACKYRIENISKIMFIYVTEHLIPKHKRYRTIGDFIIRCSFEFSA